MEHSQLPIYKTRKFWISSLVIFFILSGYVFSLLISGGFREGYWFFFDLLVSLGGMPFLLLVTDITFGYIVGLLYVLFMGYLLFSALKEEPVTISRLILFTLVYLFGILFALAY